MQNDTAKMLRFGACIAFILTLSLQANLGYAATSCAASATGPGSCHSAAAAADVGWQNPCCCHEITSCQGLVVANSIAAAETTVTRWAPQVFQAPVPRIEAGERPYALWRPNVELDIKTPPLHVLKSTFLI